MNGILPSKININIPKANINNLCHLVLANNLFLINLPISQAPMTPAKYNVIAQRAIAIRATGMPITVMAIKILAKGVIISKSNPLKKVLTGLL